MIDPWTTADDDPPFVGRAALLVGAFAVAGGVVGTAALVAAGTFLRRRLWWS